MRGGSVLLRQVCKSYRAPGGSTVVLDTFTHEVAAGTFHVLLGPSGCGKSTILNLIGGFIQPDSGEVLVSGARVGGPGCDRAMVFQDDATFPWMTVRRNIEYGLRLAKSSRRDAREVAWRFLGEVGLTAHADKYPKALSGGERKRVDLARAFANDPPIVLMDEPFGALDAVTRESLHMFVSGLWLRTKKTIICTTHDIEEAVFLADRIAVLDTRPARVRMTIDVPFPRPRPLELKTTHEFQDLRREIMRQL